MTRKEMYLAKLSGEEITTPTPISRSDYYLAMLCGAYEGELPTPISREEHYLKFICENGGLGDKIKGKLVNMNISFGEYVPPTT